MIPNGVPGQLLIGFISIKLIGWFCPVMKEKYYTQKSLNSFLKSFMKLRIKFNDPLQRTPLRSAAEREC